MGFGHPASASLAAIQFRRLQHIRSNDQELEREFTTAADSKVPHHVGPPAPWVQPGKDTGGQHQGNQQQDQAATLQRGSNHLSARVRHSVLLQELHPTHLALGQLAAAASLHPKQHTRQPTSTAAHGNLASRAANGDTTTTSANPGASYVPETCPWARLAVAAHRAKRATARSENAQRERHGGNKQQDYGMLSDTDDYSEGFSSSDEGEGSGGGNGGVWDPLAVAGALLDGSLEQRLAVHNMLWGAKAPDGGWSALEEALAPAATVQALRQELSLAAIASPESATEAMGHVGDARQGEQQQHGLQQQASAYLSQVIIDRLECAQSLHALLSDAAHSMRGADPRVHRRAVGMGLSYAEEYAERSRQAHVAWPVGEPGGTEQGLAGDVGAGDSAGAGGQRAEAITDRVGEREREQPLAQLWSEVQAARGDGRRLVGWLEEGRYGELLPGGAGSQHGGWVQGGEAARGVVGFVEATAWRTLGQLAAAGRPDAVEVLHRALLGFMLIHRAHRQPADLLQPPQGSCHPCHLAAFHVAYEAMCTHARHSHTGSTDGTSSSSGSVELPPIAVLYDALAHLPPECLVLASWARPAFEPPGPFDAGRVPPFSPQHLGLLVQVLLDQPLLAMCVSVHHRAWRFDRIAAQAGAALGSASGCGNAGSSFACGDGGRPRATHILAPSDAPAARPWARGPVDRVAKVWHKCLAIARAAEVLRSKQQSGPQASQNYQRQQQQQQQQQQQREGQQERELQQQSQGLQQPPPPHPPRPRLVEVAGGYVLYDELLRTYDNLQRRWRCGVLGAGPAAVTTLHGIRATVRRLAELGLLEEPDAGAGLPAAEVHERISKASELLRERTGLLRLTCSRVAGGGPAAGTGGGVDATMIDLLIAHVTILRPVDLPDDLLKAENALGAGGLGELRARLLQLRRAPNRAPVRAMALLHMAREVNTGVLAAHPHTWAAALQQLEALERQQDREHEKGAGGGAQGVTEAQGNPEEQRRARDARVEALRAVLIDALVGLASVMQRGPQTEHLGLALCATAGTLVAQVWDHLGAAPDPSERTVLERQLRLLPELLAHLLTVVPHGLCSFVLRELGNPMAPEEAEPPAPADGVGARPGLEAVRPPPLPDPARRLLEMYDSYARLVLYDMGCAVGALVTCRVLLGGGGDGGGGDAGGESSGASCFSEEALAQLWDYGHALVAATSTSFRAFVSRELLRLRDGGGLGRTPEEQHAGAFVAGRAAAEGGACSAGGMQQRPRAAGPPEAISGMARGGGRSGSGRRGSGGGGGGGGGSGSDDEGTGWGDDGPMSEWFALDSVWGVQPGGEANLVTALLMARMAPSIGSGFARLRLRGPEAAVLLMLCIKETEKVGLVANEAERYMLLPSLATQGEECDQFNCRPECKAVGQLGPAAAAAAAADSGAVCVEVRAGRPPLRGVSKLFVKYDWATIDRAVIHVRESSSEPKILPALRAPFLSPTQRLGAVYVEGDGAVGSMRALQLVAKVREELNKQGREIAVLVEGVLADKAIEEDQREQKRRQKLQQQGEGAGGGRADAGPTTVEDSDKHLQMLTQALKRLCTVQRWHIKQVALGSVVQPAAGAEELAAWRSGAVMAVELLRALRVTGAPMRELIVGRLLVVEVAVGDIKKCVPPPAAAAAEAGKGSKGGTKASGKGSKR